MNNRKSLVKRMFILSSFLLIGVMLLTACNGAFSVQGSANPNAEGGVDIVAGSQQQDGTTQSGTTQNMDQTTLILIIVGAVVLILVLIMLVSRRSSVDVVHHD